jgi:NADPH:quinone reductase-like Zn-dependent oxidoreductase
MKSVVLTNYGDPVRSLEYRELPEPEKPGIGQVLVGIEFSPKGNCTDCGDLSTGRDQVSRRPRTARR